MRKINGIIAGAFTGTMLAGLYFVDTVQHATSPSASVFTGTTLETVLGSLSQDLTNASVRDQRLSIIELFFSEHLNGKAPYQTTPEVRALVLQHAEQAQALLSYHSYAREGSNLTILSRMARVLEGDSTEAKKLAAKGISSSIFDDRNYKQNEKLGAYATCAKIAQEAGDTEKASCYEYLQGGNNPFTKYRVADVLRLLSSDDVKAAYAMDRLVENIMVGYQPGKELATFVLSHFFSKLAPPKTFENLIFIAQAVRQPDDVAHYAKRFLRSLEGTPCYDAQKDKYGPLLRH